MADTNTQGWGQDPLSKFLSAAEHNTVASFENLKGEVALLSEIDYLFRELVTNLNNSPGWFSGLFTLKAHSAFLASCRLALSGQVSETFVLLRSVLEYALYGFYIDRNAGSGEVWLRRHDDDASMKAMKNTFKVSSLMSALASASDKDAEVAQKLYERTIDFGGHPNKRAISQSLRLGKVEGGVRYDITYLHGPSLEMAHGLKTLAQVGTSALSIFRHLFKERFDLLGLTPRLDALKAQL